MSSSRPTEELARLAAGDDAAMSELYQRHSARVRALCHRMTGNAAAADDLAQEVFVRALRGAGQFRGDAAAGTWLYAIARNLCLDHLRRETYGAKRLARGVEERELGGHAPSPALPDPRAAILEEGLGRLSVEEREVVVLARFLGMGSARMGEVLECSPGAARVRLHRALVQLRRECLEIAGGS